MKKACVIGWPINHSRSPIIHNYWLRRHGIEGSYSRIPVPPENLKSFIDSLIDQGFSGCNCTIPHKEEVYKLVPAADDITRRIGAINTIYADKGTLRGTNTDAEGFLANLSHTTQTATLNTGKTIILGAGGAALAIICALQDAGVQDIAIANRTRARAEALRNKLGDSLEIIDWPKTAGQLADCQLLVNTTSLGMSGQPALDLQLDHLPAYATVADIIYSPLKTDLIHQAEQRGNKTVGGLGMLLHQAVRGFELWFGVKPTVTPELYTLVARDIDPSYQP